MISSFVVSYAYVNNDPPANASGAVMYGDNGAANGPDPEYTLTVGTVGSDSGRATWNPSYNSDGSWDSGWIPIELTADTTGVTFGPPLNGTTLSISNPNSNQIITGVALFVGTQLNASVQWCNIGVSFADASNNRQTYNPTLGLAVDTTTDENPAAEEQMWVAPGANDYETSVTVNGMFRFTTPAGTYPSPSDLFCEVLVFTGPANV